jgi:hypothetical protein
MKANEIQLPLNRFLGNDNSYKCILIDGEWGIGKTYEVDNFLHTKENIITVSLFGIKDLDSIYSDIVLKRIGLKKGKRNIPDFDLKGLPFYINNIATLLTPKNIFSFLTQKDKLKEYCLVFDDLERVAANFQYEEFLGMIEANRNSVHKIILIANTNQFNDINRAIHEKYNEKIIDKIYIIDELSDCLMENETNYDKELINEFIKNHEIKNIRTLQKAENLYIDVMSQISNITVNDITKPIRKICYAIVFEHIDHIYEKRIKEEENPSEKDFTYEILVKNFDARVRWKYLSDIDFPIEITDSIIKYYIFNEEINIILLQKVYINYLENKKQHTFFKSTEEIYDYIRCLEIRIKTESFDYYQLVNELDRLLVWKELFKQDCTEIIKLGHNKIFCIIDKTVDASTNIRQYYTDDFHIESDGLRQIMDNINKQVTEKYYESIFQSIKINVESKNFNQIFELLMKIDDRIYSDADFIKKFYHELLINDFIPKGNVCMEKWECWRLIVKFGRYLKSEELNCFVNTVKKENSDDIMLIHRFSESLKR